MLIQTDFFKKVDELITNLQVNHSEVAKDLKFDIVEIKNMISSYDNNFYKIDLNPFLDILNDFKIAFNTKARTTRENALRKSILINYLYHKFNLNHKQIGIITNDTRANVIYHLKNYKDRMQYDELTPILKKEFDELIENKYKYLK